MLAQVPVAKKGKKSTVMLTKAPCRNLKCAINNTMQASIILKFLHKAGLVDIAVVVKTLAKMSQLGYISDDFNSNEVGTDTGPGVTLRYSVMVYTYILIDVNDL